MLLFCVSHRLPAEATQPNRGEKREQRGTERAGDECVYECNNSPFAATPLVCYRFRFA